MPFRAPSDGIGIAGKTQGVAEGVGFEPTSPFGETVFKTAAIDHSAIPPPKVSES